MRLRRKIFLALGAALVVLTIWIPQQYYCELRAGNAAYIAELRAQGEPMTLAQVLPPAVPPAENSADIFLQAAALLDADTSLLQTNRLQIVLPVAPGKAMACSQQTAAVGSEATNSWAEIASALTQNQTALELLHQISERSRLDFHFHYEHGMGDGFDFTNLHMVELKNAAWFLSAATTSALHERDLAGAVKCQQAMFALVNAMQNQRLEISELVRIAMFHIAQSSIWETLQTPDITEGQLVTLQKDLESVNFVRGRQDALAMERITGEITLAQWRGSASGLEHYLGIGTSARETMGMNNESDNPLDKLRTSAKIFLWRYWWSYPDERRSLKGFEILLESSHFVVTNGSFQTAISNQTTGLKALQIPKIPEDPFFSGTSDFHTLMSQSVASLARTIKTVMTAETARQMTITAIALERFKLAHGHYPNHLSGLVPEFLAIMPIDPVDGQPLRYRRQADGTFLLYSVGENGVDDGGDPSPADHGTPKTFYWQNEQALDWVWPQATTADDIQFIYTPAKTAK